MDLLPDHGRHLKDVSIQNSVSARTETCGLPTVSKLCDLHLRNARGNKLHVLYLFMFILYLGTIQHKVLLCQKCIPNKFCLLVPMILLTNNWLKLVKTISDECIIVTYIVALPLAVRSQPLK